MQWIKATDRMPEDWIKAITRHWQTKHKAHYSHVKNGNPVFNVVTPENIISYVGLDSIEWLDESTELSDHAKQKLEYITGHSIATQFPNVEPHTEWAGAVLDLLKELGLIR